METKKKQGWGAKRPAATPLSVEELIRKKKEADAATAKVSLPSFGEYTAAQMYRSFILIFDPCLQPKFLSKAQREKLALEKRAQEVEAERQAKAGANGGDRNGFAPEPSSARPHEPRNSREDQGARHVPTGPRSMRDEASTGPAAMRKGGRQARDHDMPPPPKATKGEKRLTEEDSAVALAALTKQRYMGAEQTSNFSAKKKRKRTTDRKFNFDWNTEEDTSGDYDPLYQHRHEANFFGRGRLAGFGDDVANEVTRKYAEALETRDREAGGARAKEIMEMERRRREDSTRNQLDKHWSEKRLEHMRERDWRIFKEDFNISTKGGSVPNPMRSWEESLAAKAPIGACRSRRIQRTISDSACSYPNRSAVP